MKTMASFSTQFFKDLVKKSNIQSSIGDKQGCALRILFNLDIFCLTLETDVETFNFLSQFCYWKTDIDCWSQRCYLTFDG